MNHSLRIRTLSDLDMNEGRTLEFVFLLTSVYICCQLRRNAILGDRRDPCYRARFYSDVCLELCQNEDFEKRIRDLRSRVRIETDWRNGHERSTAKSSCSLLTRLTNARSPDSLTRVVSSPSRRWRSLRNDSHERNDDRCVRPRSSWYLIRVRENMEYARIDSNYRLSALSFLRLYMRSTDFTEHDQDNWMNFKGHPRCKRIRQWFDGSMYYVLLRVILQLRYSRRSASILLTRSVQHMYVRSRDSWSRFVHWGVELDLFEYASYRVVVFWRIRASRDPSLIFLSSLLSVARSTRRTENSFSSGLENYNFFTLSEKSISRSPFRAQNRGDSRLLIVSGSSVRIPVTYDSVDDISLNWRIICQ